MSSRSRRPDPDHFSWPPVDEDVEVVDLESHGSPEQAQSSCSPRWQALWNIRPHLRGRTRSGRLGRLPLERAGLLVLALLAVAQGVFILAGTKRDPAFPPAPSRSSAAGRASQSLGTTEESVAADKGTTSSPLASAGAGAAAAALTGHLFVRTQPPGAAVSLDGTRLGVAPVSVPRLAPGEHKVVIRSRTQTIEENVTIRAGEMVSLVVPLAAVAAPSPSGGSLTVHSAVELRIREGGRLLGTSLMSEVPLAAGTHRLELSNETVGYLQNRTVSVSAGKTTRIDLQIAEERVAINATPWAEVWIDGARVGETPLGSLTLPLGPHLILFRHPRLGEKTVKTLVRANEPGRISVDMRK